MTTRAVVLPDGTDRREAAVEMGSSRDGKVLSEQA